MSRAACDAHDGDSLSQFRSAVDRLFKSFDNDASQGATRGKPGAFPPVALSERPEQFVIRMELQGVRTEDLEITYQGRTLEIRGEQKDTEDSADPGVPREWPTGPFTRSIELPSEVDASGIRAELDDGILRIAAPKAKRASGGRSERFGPSGPSVAPKEAKTTLEQESRSLEASPHSAAGDSSRDDRSGPMGRGSESAGVSHPCRQGPAPENPYPLGSPSLSETTLGCP